MDRIIIAFLYKILRIWLFHNAFLKVFGEVGVLGLFQIFLVIVLKPILNGFFKSPFELETALFNLFTVYIGGDLEFLDAGKTDVHRAAYLLPVPLYIYPVSSKICKQTL